MWIPITSRFLKFLLFQKVNSKQWFVDKITNFIWNYHKNSKLNTQINVVTKLSNKAWTQYLYPTLQFLQYFYCWITTLQWCTAYWWRWLWCWCSEDILLRRRQWRLMVKLLEIRPSRCTHTTKCTQWHIKAHINKHLIKTKIVYEHISLFTGTSCRFAVITFSLYTWHLQ